MKNSKKYLLLPFLFSSALFSSDSNVFNKQSINNSEHSEIIQEKPFVHKNLHNSSVLKTPKAEHNTTNPDNIINPEVVSNVQPPLPMKDEKKVKKINEESYDMLIDMLKSTEESAELEALKMEQAKAKEVEEIQKEEQTKAEQEEEKMLLPIPLRSISLGNKVILYAEYREKSVSDKVNPIKQQNVKDTQNLKFNNYVIVKKEIKLTTGDVFNDWKITKINPNYVSYQNIETDEIIKKYY